MSTLRIDSFLPRAGAAAVVAFATALSLLALLAPPSARADGGKPAPRRLEDRVELAGKIVCIGCTLEALPAGADAQCTLHAKHAQGLLLPDDTLWTFVDNAKGHLVMTNEKLRGKEVKVLGWSFPKAQYVEVSKFQVKDGANWVAYDYCKSCGFEPGDNKDRDLCDDCAGEK
ncbi:MAG: hypothetical protein HYZ53_21795 [Planctomycetes bacterium]|nr:hypothetical protein [Planctomycetota bacterium]